MIDDATLLRQYADTGSEEAFAALVRRNLDLVYATALRIVGDGARAEDVAQSVFVAFARKAAALRDHPAPVSWLYTSARYAALKSLRTERRRQVRELAAHHMQHLLESDPPPDWERLRPLLDDVLHELNEADRAALLLRFFRGAPFAELAAALRVNEGAARMRVDRALTRMNRLLGKRGIHSSAAALGAVLAAQPAVAAPPALAATINGAALAGAAAGGGGLAAVLFAMNKLKLALAAAVVVGGFATALVEGRTQLALRDQQRALAAGDLAPLEQRNRQLQAAVAQLGDRNPEVAELNRLRARLATLRARPPGVVDAAFLTPRNLGRATPAAAVETFAWAIDHGDLDLAASFISFTDDSPKNREAFLANFSDAIRARYGTVERIYAAALYGAIHGKAGIPDPVARLQIARIEERSFDQVRVDLWFRTEGGREVPGRVTYQRRADGWAEKPVAMLAPEVIAAIRQRLDPATGAFIPPGPAKP